MLYTDHELLVNMTVPTVYACGLQYCYLLTEACHRNCMFPLAVVTADLENAIKGTLASNNNRLKAVM